MNLDGIRGVRNRGFNSSKESQQEFLSEYGDIIDSILNKVWRPYYETKYPNGVEYQERNWFKTDKNKICLVLQDFYNRVLFDENFKTLAQNIIWDKYENISTLLLSSKEDEFYQQGAFVGQRVLNGQKRTVLVCPIGEDCREEPGCIITNAHRLMLFAHEISHVLSGKWIKGQKTKEVTQLNGEIDSLFIEKIFIDYLAQFSDFVAGKLSVSPKDKEYIKKLIEKEKVLYEIEMEKGATDKLTKMVSRRHVAGFDRWYEMRYIFGEVYADSLYRMYNQNPKDCIIAIKRYEELLETGHLLNLDDTAKLVTGGEIKTADAMIRKYCSIKEQETEKLKEERF